MAENDKYIAILSARDAGVKMWAACFWPGHKEVYKVCAWAIAESGLGEPLVHNPGSGEVEPITGFLGDDGSVIYCRTKALAHKAVDEDSEED